MADYHITWRAIMDKWREWGLTKKNANAMKRKADFLLGTDGGEAPPTTILSLPGSKMGCLNPGSVFPTYQTNFADIGGTLYTWGANIAGNTMGLPDEAFALLYSTPTVHPLHPGKVIDASGVQQVATVLVFDDGDVWVFSNAIPTNGHLDVSGMVGSCGYNTLPAATAFHLLSDDGTVYGFGRGMAGMGEYPTDLTPAFHWTDDLWTPTQMPTEKVSGVVQISALADSFLFLTESGDVGNWRNNEEFPRYVSGSTSSPITKIAGGSSHVAALTDDGHIFVTGDNFFGTFGNSTNDSDEDPFAWHETDLDGWTDLACLGAITFGVKDGRLYSWGLGGPLSARGTSAPAVNTPTLVADFGEVVSVHGLNVAANGMARVSGGCTWIWGLNQYGYLGQGYIGGQVGEPILLEYSAAWPAWAV